MRNYLLYFLLAVAIVAFVGMSILYRSEAHRFFGIANSDAVEINYPYAYRVEKLYVKRGQTIQKGDKLARLIRNDLILEKQITTNQLAENQSEEQLKINQLKAQIKELELEHKMGRDKLSFQISDLEQKIKLNRELLATITPESGSHGSNSSLIQLEQLKRERKNATALYQGKKRSLKKELNDQVALFKQRQKRLGTELQGMKKEEKALEVMAPFDGIVAQINHRVHEDVEAFEPLMVLNNAKPT
jgi:multidrug resistance efflux pump